MLDYRVRGPVLPEALPKPLLNQADLPLEAFRIPKPLGEGRSPEGRKRFGREEAIRQFGHRNAQHGKCPEGVELDSEKARSSGWSAQSDGDVPEPDKIQTLLFTQMGAALRGAYEGVLATDDQLGATVGRDEAHFGSRQPDLALEYPDGPKVWLELDARFDIGNIHSFTKYYRW